jgi:iron complex transport system substrate-binding protein
MDILIRAPDALAVLLALLFTVMSLPASAAPDVHDDTGRRVVLAAPAERIVTLAPHATELVVSAGAAERLVAIAAGSTAPPGLGGLPQIGGAGPLDRETLLATGPDLVIGWQSGNRADDLDWLARAGIPVYRSEPRGLEDIARSIRSIGQLAGTPALAAEAARGFMEAVRTDCARLPPVPALVLVWGRPPMTVGGRHWINAVLHAAGFSNHFAGVPAGVFQVAPEALLAANAAHRLSLVPGAVDDAMLADLLSRPGPRLAVAVQRLCQRRLLLMPQQP